MGIFTARRYSNKVKRDVIICMEPVFLLQQRAYKECISAKQEITSISQFSILQKNPGNSVNNLISKL